MKNRFWIALSLAALMIIPAAAQTSPASSNQDQTTATQQTPDQAAADQNLQAHQPLTYEKHEGFWGKINPFARKKYVQRQLGPVRDRVNELDELTAANAKNIKDVDASAQRGIQLAHNKASEADMHAVDAGNRAQQAQQTATQASNRIQTVEQVVNNIDQYKPVTQTEIRFRPGQTVLSQKAKDALDEMAKGLKDQKGYILEIQGFSAGHGVTAIESSQRMAEAVRRYLVINNDVPVYRVHVLGLGNMPTTASDGSKQRIRGARVDVALLKNDLEQLSSAQPMASGAVSTQGGVSGTATESQPANSNAPATTNGPASNLNAPNSTPATAQPVSPAQQQPSAAPSTQQQRTNPPQQ